MQEDRFDRLYSREASGAQPSAIRDLCSLVARPEVRSLAGGWPDPAVFPARAVGRIFSDLLPEFGDRMLQYGSTEGLLELRQVLASKMEAEGIAGADPEDILILHGSAQGMHLAAQVFLDRNDVVMVGLPTYFGGSGAVQSRGGKCAGVVVDRDGLNTEVLDRKVKDLKAAGEQVKGVYVIPSFQNPTGVTLSLDRRRHLVRLAEAHDFMIFEDDPYCELRFEGEPVPSLMSLDEHGRVIHLRSLSKTFSPGMRLGWAAGDRGAIHRMTVAKQFDDCATNTPAQFILLEFIRRGLLDAQIQTNVAHYRAKRDLMLELLERHFPEEVTWNRPEGGFFVFVHLPEKWDAGELFREAVHKDVAFVTGQPFFVDGSGHNTLRLSYSQARPEDIEAAVKEIGALMKERIAHPRPQTP